MTGLCGWIGASPVEAADDILRRMGSALCRFDHSRLSTDRSQSTALAAAGDTRTSLVLVDGPVALAVAGHPRWECGNSHLNDIRAVGLAFLEAYRRSGTQALTSVKGDFALALLNGSDQEAILAVDRIGVCNLVYQESRGGLIFGSTGDALTAHPQVRRELDHQGIYNYAYFHMVPGPRTIFRGQQRLSPGHFLRYKDGRISSRPYWEMRFVENGDDSIEQFRTPFLSALREGVATAADFGQCGAFLSGGTDSSTVAGLISRETGGPARTYSIGFDAEGFDEMQFARLASRHFKTIHHEYYVTPDDVVTAIPAIADVFDQPFGNASAIPTYFCARLAKSDGITRLLGGDGGDELFGGNARYAKQYQLSLYEKIPAPLRQGVEAIVFKLPGGNLVPLVRKARSYIDQASSPMPARYEAYNLLERLGAANVFTADFLATVDQTYPHTLMKETYDAAHASSLINRMLALDLKFTLADNDLLKVTRMCELAGVDITFPMLHESVVDLSALLPPSMKLRGTRLRYFFKEALRDLLPNEIITKEKHGFGLPVGAWLLSHPPLREMAGDSLQDLRGRGIVRPAFIDALLGERMRTHPGYYGTMVWILMMLEFWFSKYTNDHSRAAQDACTVQYR